MSPHLQVPSTLLWCPEFMALTGRNRDRAISAWLLGGVYVAESRSNGLIPAGAAKTLRLPPAGIRELVRVGLWRETDGGWYALYATDEN